MIYHAFRPAIAYAGLLLALGFCSTNLLAQQVEADDEAIDEIRVLGPRVEREPLRGPGAPPIPSWGSEITMELSSVVSYADLDLAQHADVIELEERITSAARSICEELATELPQGEPEAEACFRQATDRAMAEADEIIAAAAENSDAG